MNIAKNHPRNDQALAMVATLALFVILTAMVAVMLRNNATTRIHLKTKRDYTMALCLAESGVEEALHVLSSGRSDVAQISRTVGRGGFKVSWEKVEGRPSVYEIFSTGAVGPTEKHVQKQVRVRVAVSERDSVPPREVRVLVWTLQ